MLSQVSSAYSFPSYNVALGLWGAYSAFSKHGRATFGLICFQALAVLLDVIFCSVNGKADKSASFKFALTMLVFSLFAKVIRILLRVMLWICLSLYHAHRLVLWRDDWMSFLNLFTARSTLFGCSLLLRYRGRVLYEYFW